ncbi:MAG: hypothetical protein ACRDL7_02500 [Gaiellaceae bacterium]
MNKEQEIDGVSRFQAQIEDLIRPAWELLTPDGMTCLAIALERVAVKLRQAAAEQSGCQSSPSGDSSDSYD